MLLNLINVVPETNTVRRVQKRLFPGGWVMVVCCCGRGGRVFCGWIGFCAVSVGATMSRIRRVDVCPRAVVAPLALVALLKSQIISRLARRSCV